MPGPKGSYDDNEFNFSYLDDDNETNDVSLSVNTEETKSDVKTIDDDGEIVFEIDFGEDENETSVPVTSDVIKNIKQEEENEPEFEETATVSGSSSMAQVHRLFIGKMEQLYASKDTSWFVTFKDSPRMSAVKEAINDVEACLDKPLPMLDKSGFADDVRFIIDRYERLIGRCDTYVEHIEGKKKGRSKSGKKRLALTKEILEQGKLELDFFKSMTFDVYKSYWDNNKKLWSEVLLDENESVNEVTNEAVSQTENETASINSTENVAESTNAITVVESVESSSRQNVSSMKLANALGIENLISSKGPSKIGGQHKGKKTKSGEKVTGRTLGDVIGRALNEGCQVDYAPSVVRQICTLQFFDLICGNSEDDYERSLDDCITTYVKKGELITVTDLKGTDMGMSVSLRSMELLMERLSSIDTEGIGLPYLPRGLYNRIMSVSLTPYLDNPGNGESADMAQKTMNMRNVLKSLVDSKKIKLLDDRGWENEKSEIFKAIKLGILKNSFFPVDVLTNLK